MAEPTTIDASRDFAKLRARPLGRGTGWRANEFVCTAGPADRPFEERHDGFTVAFVVEGTFTYRSATGAALLHPGAILLGNAGTCFECGHIHGIGDRCLSITLEDDHFAEIAASRLGTGRFRFPAAVLPADRRRLALVTRAETRLGTRDRSAIDEVVMEIVEAVLDQFGDAASRRRETAARDHRRIAEVVRHIEDGSHAEIDLDGLAALAAMSRYHFLRCFRDVIGTTPYRYLHDLRMRRAAKRLLETAEPVTTIAYDCGFGDLSTFCNGFRALYGKSPRAFRLAERRPQAGPRRAH